MSQLTNKIILSFCCLLLAITIFILSLTWLNLKNSSYPLNASVVSLPNTAQQDIEIKTKPQTQEKNISPTPKPGAPKKIIIDLNTQTLSKWQGKVKIDQFLISSGINNSTPKGTFSIVNKIPMVHSKKYDCWLPFWMAFTKNGKYGFHELPICNSNTPKRQGLEQIGMPSSHGCIRLDLSHAQKLYNWATIGTQIIIQ